MFQSLDNQILLWYDVMEMCVIRLRTHKVCIVYVRVAVT
jgi:hypothetical protein